MNIKTVRLLFEQSGTFKSQFELLGYKAFDYDIENQFDKTDYVIDLFNEINKAYENKPSIFDEFDKDDLIIAFFPCTYFSIQNQLAYRKQLPQFKKWSDDKVNDYLDERKRQRDIFYKTLLRFIEVVEKRGFKTVIENPYSGNYLLEQKEIKQPSLVIQDRRVYGDYYRKPTMFYYYNFEPSYMTEFLRITNNEKKYINYEGGITRSLIHKDFAYNFINKYILGVR